MPSLSSVPRRRPVDVPKSGPKLAAYLSERSASGEDPYDVLALSDSASLAEILAEVERLQAAVDGDPAGLQALERLTEAARGRRAKLCETHGPSLLAEGEWAQAASVYEDLLHFNKGDVPTRVTLAWVRFQSSTRSKRDAQRTLDALDRFVASDDELVDAHYYRGELLRVLERDGPAKRAFERALELDPGHAEAAEQVAAMSGAKARPKKPARSAPRPEPRPAPNPAEATHLQSILAHYWSGPWPAIWIVFGLLLVLMLGAQVVLRLNSDF